jgi:hypothetical protein
MHKRVAGVLAVAIVCFALTSHFALAATTVQINDPITDAVQLWSAIAISIDTAAHQLAADLAYLGFPAHPSRAAASTTTHLNPPPAVAAPTQRSASLAAAAASVTNAESAQQPTPHVIIKCQRSAACAASGRAFAAASPYPPPRSRAITRMEG